MTFTDLLEAIAYQILKYTRSQRMSQAYYNLYLAVPLTDPNNPANPSPVEVVNGFYFANFARDPVVDEFSPLLGTETGEGTHRFTADTSTTASMLASLRPQLSPGGDLYDIGVRGRLAFFSALESTTDPPPNGKVLVTLLDVGATLPTTPEEWETHRVTQGRFFEEVAASVSSAEPYGIKEVPF